MLAAAEEREYLVCDSCGEFRSLDPGALDGARALIEREFGYRAGFTHFPVVGLCPDCADRVERGGRRMSFEFLFRPRRGGSTRGSPAMFDGAPLLVALGIAFVLGLRHASDPDHLVAVTSLVAAEDGDARSAMRLGAWWGAGHGLVLLAVGVPLIALKSELPGLARARGRARGRGRDPGARGARVLEVGARRLSRRPA